MFIKFSGDLMFSLPWYLATLACAFTFTGADQIDPVLAGSAGNHGESASVLQAVVKVGGGGEKGTAPAGTLRSWAMLQVKKGGAGDDNEGETTDGGEEHREAVVVAAAVAIHGGQIAGKKVGAVEKRRFPIAVLRASRGADGDGSTTTTATSTTTPRSYNKVPNTYCDEKLSGYDTYASLREAELACDSADQCNVVADGSCDGPPFTLCTGPYPSDKGSCTWQNEGYAGGDDDDGYNSYSYEIKERTSGFSGSGSSPSCLTNQEAYHGNECCAGTCGASSLNACYDCPTPEEDTVNHGGPSCFREGACIADEPRVACPASAHKKVRGTGTKYAGWCICPEGSFCEGKACDEDGDTDDNIDHPRDRWNPDEVSAVVFTSSDIDPF